MENNDIQMLRLGFEEDEKEFYEASKIGINKKMRRFFSDARKNAKQGTCFTCGKECSSFCKSHSVPKFCLKQVAVNGKVYFSGMQSEIPFMGDDSGIKEAGTFQLICRECDSTLFQDYESPAAYNSRPTGKILAEIAMKDYLQIISKRLQERSLYLLTEEQFPQNRNYARHQQEIIDLDLVEFTTAYQRAKAASSGKHNDWYYLCYYRQLDYVVPFAMQSRIVMICDFEGNVINDIYNMSPDYHTKEIHVAVFPLEKTSIILMFLDSREKRYRKFYRQLNKLELDDQLAAINYIIHSYCENVFLSKNISEDILKDKNFLDVSQKSSIVTSSLPFGNALQTAIMEFSLAKRNEIPNLLSTQNALLN